ncbi:MAG: hypothetical protein ACD_23C01038G0002 [uncultured bacterium]|nr:MAG: hypothetical protein ACD_23C01038G0002 [uncultured bacterium]
MAKQVARHTPMTRSEIMSRIRSHNTLPEMVVRRMVHAMGYRFRLYRRDLPGAPDLVLPRHSAVIFVHGCFWHQHAVKSCAVSHKPKSNLDYWLPKLEKNVKRDARNTTQLKALGWRVLVLWECQLSNEASVRRRIERFLQSD